MAATDVRQARCDVVDLSSDDELTIPRSKGRVSSMPTQLINVHGSIHEDVVTSSSSSSLPHTSNILPPSSRSARTRARSDRFISIADEDTPMRQAAKRRKLNGLLADASSIAGETMLHRSSSQSRSTLGSEPRPTPGDNIHHEKNARLTTVQTVLGFSNDDLSNFEVAAGGSDNLLESLEDARAQKAREALDFPFCSPGDNKRQANTGSQNPSNKSIPKTAHRIEGDCAVSKGSGTIREQNFGRRPLQEGSFNILSNLSNQEGPQPTERQESSLAKGLGEAEEAENLPRPQSTILDMCEYLNDNLDDSLPPLPAFATSGQSSRRRECAGGAKYQDSMLNSAIKERSTITLGQRRVSVVSLGSDPVVVSTRKPANTGKTNSRIIWGEGDEQSDILKAGPMGHDIFEDVSDFCVEEAKKGQPRLSESTAQLLAGVSAKSKAKPRHRTVSGNQDRKDDAKAMPRRSDISRTASLQSTSTELISGSQSKALKRPRLNSVEREVQRQEREQTRAREAEERAKSKEEREEQKRLEKERKAKEKKIAADLAEANKARMDRKITTPELIVDLPLSMEGMSVYTQIAPFLADLKVQSTTYTSPIADVIRFRRKVTARWSDDLGHWEPAPLTIESEKHILCLLDGKDFAKMAALGHGLENHVAKVRNEFPSSQPIYLVEGIEALLRKSRNSKNRAFMDDVRNRLSDVQGSQGQRRKASKADEIIDADIIEDGLFQLQLIHKVQVHHTDSSVETAKWIAVFTQHISTIPYKIQRSTAEASFCMDVGQVRTGDDKADTYVKMLQEIVRVTLPVALGIASEYPDVTSLVRGFREGGPLILENITRNANSNGALSDARIGPALSRRLYNVFMGRDPKAMDS